MGSDGEDVLCHNLTHGHLAGGLIVRRRSNERLPDVAVAHDSHQVSMPVDHGEVPDTVFFHVAVRFFYGSRGRDGNDIGRHEFLC